MPGSGNLGDDLISGLLVKKLFAKYQPRFIGILCGENSIDSFYDGFLDKIIFFKKPNRKNLKEFVKRSKSIKLFIKKCDLVIVGGGGLLQDVHSPLTIYNYLKYTQIFSKKVLLLGIGVGPINYLFNKLYLRKILTKEYFIQVRDYQSKVALQSMGVKSRICVDSDIVEGSGKDDYINGIQTLSKSDLSVESHTLGCNVRNWQDIKIDDFVFYVVELIKHFNINLIKFFAFENGIGNSTEKLFAKTIINRLTVHYKINCELYTYNEIDKKTFFKNFYSVTFAIASRFHANILWQQSGIKTIPIVYDPKVRSLYVKHNIAAYPFKELFLMSKSRKFPFEIINMSNSEYSLPKINIPCVRIKYCDKIINEILEFFYFLFEAIKSFETNLFRGCVKVNFDSERSSHSNKSL